jgi:hypothetical protein
MVVAVAPSVASCLLLSTRQQNRHNNIIVNRSIMEEPLYAVVHRNRNKMGPTSAAHLLELSYGERANAAATVIQRAFRAQRLQSQFTKLMCLAMSADRLENRLSLLGPGNDKTLIISRDGDSLGFVWGGGIILRNSL